MCGRFRLPFPSQHDVGAARGPPPGTTRNTPQPRSFEMDPVVTIIVTPRDRYSGLDECIDSVYRHTQEPFRLWILDLAYPASIIDPVRKRLLGRTEARLDRQSTRLNSSHSFASCMPASDCT